MQKAKQLAGGHCESVLCLSATNGALLSGGEDGELCHWTFDQEKPITMKIGTGGDVSSICNSKQRPYELYIACGQKIHQFDMRQLSEPVHTLGYNEDDINQVILNKKEDYLAACDDCGHIKIINVQDRHVHKTLKNHTNICSTVAFNPKKGQELISGGLDCTVLQWDFIRAKNFNAIDMREIETSNSSNADGYLVNPPLIHSISLSDDCSTLACGTEDGLIHLFDSTKKKLKHMSILKHHKKAVGQVRFMITADKSFLLSAGNDGKIAIWNFDDVDHSEKYVEESNKDTKKIVQGFIKEIVHGSKINWIESMVIQDKPTIAVADCTNKITLYDFPV